MPEAPVKKGLDIHSPDLELIAEEERLAAHDHIELGRVDHAERLIGREHLAHVIVARGQHHPADLQDRLDPPEHAEEPRHRGEYRLLDKALQPLRRRPQNRCGGQVAHRRSIATLGRWRP